MPREQILDAAGAVTELWNEMELHMRNRVEAKTGRSSTLELSKLSNIMSHAALSHADKPRAHIPAVQAWRQDSGVIVPPEQQHALREVFMFYTSWAEKHNFLYLSRSQFLRFCRDTLIMRGELDSVSLSLVYDKALQVQAASPECDGGARLTRDVWVAALQALASVLYPQLAAQEAWERLVAEHVLKFGARLSSDWLAPVLLRPDVVEAIGKARSKLRPVFRYYCSAQSFSSNSARGRSWLTADNSADTSPGAGVSHTAPKAGPCTQQHSGIPQAQPFSPSAGGPLLKGCTDRAGSLTGSPARPDPTLSPVLPESPRALTLNPMPVTLKASELAMQKAMQAGPGKPSSAPSRSHHQCLQGSGQQPTATGGKEGPSAEQGAALQQSAFGGLGWPGSGPVHGESASEAQRQGKQLDSRRSTPQAATAAAAAGLRLESSAPVAAGQQAGASSSDGATERGASLAGACRTPRNALPTSLPASAPKSEPSTSLPDQGDASLAMPHQTAPGPVIGTAPQGPSLRSKAVEAARNLMPLNTFLRCLQDFDVMPQRVSTAQAAVAFRAACFGAAQGHSPDTGRIDFDKFLEALARCALMAYNFQLPKEPTYAMNFNQTYEPGAKALWSAAAREQLAAALDLPDEVSVPAAERSTCIGMEDAPHHDVRDLDGVAGCRPAVPGLPWTGSASTKTWGQLRSSPQAGQDLPGTAHSFWGGAQSMKGRAAGIFRSSRSLAPYRTNTALCRHATLSSNTSEAGPTPKQVAGEGAAEVLAVHDEAGVLELERPPHLAAFTPDWVGRPALPLRETARLARRKLDPSSGLYSGGQTGLPSVFDLRMTEMIDARVAREQAMEALHLVYVVKRREALRAGRQQAAAQRQQLQVACQQRLTPHQVVLLQQG